MKSSLLTPRHIFIATAILLAGVSRLLPHPFNFTPVAAMALFGGACLSDKRLAFLLPMGAMIFSDILLELTAGIGIHNTLIYVYGSFLIISGIGIFISKKLTASRIILASLLSSLLFFFITNTGVWAAAGFPFGFNGLLTSLLAGIPFYNNELFGSFFFNTVAGDLFFNAILFGSLALAKNRFPAMVKAKA